MSLGSSHLKSPPLLQVGIPSVHTGIVFGSNVPHLATVSLLEIGLKQIGSESLFESVHSLNDPASQDGAEVGSGHPATPSSQNASLNELPLDEDDELEELEEEDEELEEELLEEELQGLTISTPFTKAEQMSPELDELLEDEEELLEEDPPGQETVPLEGQSLETNETASISFQPLL